MARIRSVHPGFFTDEDLVQVSMAARLLFIGIGVEADDKGAFEWKPLTLKMRIFPADSIEIEPLLSELEGANAIASYEINGRKYGAIRNFRKFQRPKTPNDIHPIPDDFRKYVGLTQSISEPFPQKGEKSPQMEDGGGRMKGKDGRGKKEEQSRASEHVYDKLIEAASCRGQCHPSLALGFAQISDLLDKGYDLEKDVLPIIRERAKPEISSWAYFVKIIINRKAERDSIPEKAKPKPIDWPRWIEAFKLGGIWKDELGPKPGEPGCLVPPEFLGGIEQGGTA